MKITDTNWNTEAKFDYTVESFDHWTGKMWLTSDCTWTQDRDNAGHFILGEARRLGKIVGGWIVKVED